MHMALSPGPCLFSLVLDALGHRSTAQLSLPLYLPRLLQWLPKCPLQPLRVPSILFLPARRIPQTLPTGVCLTPAENSAIGSKFQVLTVTHYATLVFRACSLPRPRQPRSLCSTQMPMRSAAGPHLCTRWFLSQEQLPAHTPAFNLICRPRTQASPLLDAGPAAPSPTAHPAAAGLSACCPLLHPSQWQWSACAHCEVLRAQRSHWYDVESLND